VAIREGLAAALGFGRRTADEDEAPDTGTRLAYRRTDLAVERSYLAAERTLMAWVRTTLSMISFGFTIGKLGQTVSAIQVPGALHGPRMVSVETIAYFLVVLGTMMLAGAISQFLVSVAGYVRMGLRRRVSITVILGLILVVLGGFAFTSLVTGL
jgi:putative membrane protein